MDDREYHARRAERQFELAQRATEPAAWNAHYGLAALHLDRLQEQAGRSAEAAEEQGKSAG